MRVKYLPLIVLVTLLANCKNKISGQELIKTLSVEVCQCIELKKYKNATEIRPCFDSMFENHYNSIKEYYKTKELTKAQFNEFGNKIAAIISQDCKYVRNNFPTGFVGEKREKQQNIKCEEFKESKFYYLTKKPNSEILDTTFVTISNGQYLEKFRSRTTYSLSKIIWKENCTFSLKFEHSDDPFRKELFSKGQIFNYEIIANEDKSFFVETEWKNQVFQYQMFKLK